MKNTSRRLLRLAAGAAVAGTVTIGGATAAQATTYNLTSGALSQTQATSTISSTNPPTVGDGSWVTLPEDGSTTSYFSNSASRTADGRYTAIDSGGASGIELGTTQTGGAFSTNTKFNSGGGALQFDANVSAAKLRFNTALGTDAWGYTPLVANATYSDLTGFQIVYPAGSSNTYNVGGSVTTGGIYLDPLQGGYKSADSSYWLQWRTNIVSSDAFNNYEAKFHLEGTHA